MSKNLLIVESENDKHFIERLKQEVTKVEVDLDTPICNTLEYEFLDGLSFKRLESKLHEIKFDIEKKGLEKIGILLDADNQGIDERVNLINAAVKIIDSELHMLAVNTWYQSQLLDVSISCHILNVNGEGELETLLKTIASKSSSHADCLNTWQQCLNSNNQTLSNKDFDKFWVSIYQRYDCCNNQERKQAGKNCSLKASLKKDIWDFSHPALNDLKNYLLMFD